MCSESCGKCQRRQRHCWAAVSQALQSEARGETVYLPRGSLLAMTYFLLRDYNVLPNKELDWSPWVQLKRKERTLLRKSDCNTAKAGPVDCSSPALRGVRQGVSLFWDALASSIHYITTAEPQVGLSKMRLIRLCAHIDENLVVQLISENPQILIQVPVEPSKP